MAAPKGNRYALKTDETKTTGRGTLLMHFGDDLLTRIRELAGEMGASGWVREVCAQATQRGVRRREARTWYLWAARRGNGYVHIYPSLEEVKAYRQPGRPVQVLVTDDADGPYWGAEVAGRLRCIWLGEIAFRSAWDGVGQPVRLRVEDSATIHPR
jgi:hypothetical protein